MALALALVISSKSQLQYRFQINANAFTISLLPLLLFTLQFSVVAINGLQFHQVDFSDTTNITLQESSFTSGSYVWLLPNPDPSWHTDPTNTTATRTWQGWMSYTLAMPFLSTDTATQQVTAQSFNTSFTFKILTPGNYGSCPSGMAFFVTPYGNPPITAINRYFGISSDQNPEFFAVEFDTLSSAYTTDTSSSHIGIDISSVNSSAVVDTSNSPSGSHYPELFLYNNYTFTAWVSYDASSKLISVWMTNRSDEYSSYLDPPDDYTLLPILQYQYDLSSVFSTTPSNLYVGFSAATESDTSMLGVIIYSWYFSINDSSSTATAAPPAKSPSTSTGNVNTPSNSDGSSSKIRYVIIIPSAVGGFLVIVSAIGIAIFCCYCKNKPQPVGNKSKCCTPEAVGGAAGGCNNGSGVENPENDKPETGFTAAVTLPRYSFQELQIASKNFKFPVGEGTYSRVYRGTLVDGSVVAIKRLKDGVRKEAEFSAELRMINTIRHRNLLQLHGWCYDNAEAMLVYKFMSNGNLRKHLTGDRRGTLDGKTRLRILSEVAAALEYLHFGLGDCVLHRDVKAENVFLTETFDAVLGDFGLVRLVKHNEAAITLRVAGTLGYMAPEVVGMGRLTDKADVYSFGVLMLEVACGRQVFIKKPIPGERMYIVEHVLKLQECDRLAEAIDPTILQLESSRSDNDQSYVSRVYEHWLRIFDLALICCQQEPESRPNMRYVNQEIIAIVQLAAGVNHCNISSFPSPASSIRSPYTKYTHFKRNSHDTSWSAGSAASSDYSGFRMDRKPSTSGAFDVYNVTPR